MPPARQTARIDAALPPGAAGQWCVVTLTLPHGDPWWAQLELSDPDRAQVVRDCFLGTLRATRQGAGRATLVHVPATASAATVVLYGRQSAGAALRIAPLSRIAATGRLLWQGARLIAPSLAGDAHGRLGRLRAVLGQAPARAGEAPPYTVWIETFEAALPPPPAADAEPQVVICGTDAAALNATLASLAGQTMPAALPLRIQAEADWRAVSAPWVVVLQAGEILAPNALAWFAHAADANPHAALITADCDRLLGDGTRAGPFLKPGADSLLLRSGLPTQGACALRWPALPPPLPVQAEQARRALALPHADATVHVPRILTHISEAAPPLPQLQAATPRARDFAPSVIAIVPSAIRSAHARHCLRRVVEETDYPAFSVDVIISDQAAANPKLLRQMQALPRLRIRTIDLPNFNYAAANNKGAEHAHGDLLLLLNDDVAPRRPDWLSAMVAHMQDPRVGIVGARLFYGNGMVQHEGVIMGLAHLCEHAGRLRAGGDDGPHGLARIDRQVSAVTAACLLIRADLYRALGGMDENFAIALNDVDLCLRARAAGSRVVYCAHAEMWHYESLSLGRHYAGSRAALESLEVRRLQSRWPGAIAADPFYNPLASLEPGREWQPGFPPRTAGLAAGAPNHAATLLEKS
jgi:GT2 family glycosyltransferase